jgi:hypothetical protein
MLLLALSMSSAALSMAGEALAQREALKDPFPSISHDLTALHDAKRVLVNPHKGWYHHFPDNHPNKYQIARDADLLEFPGMDHLYMRLARSEEHTSELQSQR